MSPLTRYLSRLLGVFLLVTAVSEWTQPRLLTVVAPAMVDQPALSWVSGMLTFVAGLAIVLGHNVWSDPAAVVVSFLGWRMTIKGAALLLVPAAGWTALLGADASTAATDQELRAVARRSQSPSRVVHHFATGSRSLRS